MLDELLKEVVVMLVGKGAEPIATLLNSNKYVNEFNIAKEMGMTINQTRNILYRISDYNLILSERKKDTKIGWYTYSWKFDILKTLEFLRNHLLEEKAKIESEIEKRQGKPFYVCKDCNLEFNENDALLMNFTCDECGETFTMKDNSQLISSLNKSLQKIIERLVEINLEIENEHKKLDKKKQVQLKKEEKEKEEKKEEAKKKRDMKRKEKLANLKVEKKARTEKVKIKKKKNKQINTAKSVVKKKPSKK